MIPENMRTSPPFWNNKGSRSTTYSSRKSRQGQHANKEYQHDYLLTLELVDVRTGNFDKQSAEISKGYHQTRVSRWSATNPFGLK